MVKVGQAKAGPTVDVLFLLSALEAYGYRKAWGATLDALGCVPVALGVEETILLGVGAKGDIFANQLHQLGKSGLGGRCVGVAFEQAQCKICHTIVFGQSNTSRMKYANGQLLPCE